MSVEVRFSNARNMGPGGKTRDALEALADALEDFLGDEDVDGRIPVALGFDRYAVSPLDGATVVDVRLYGSRT